jgi:invasion protein IalB
MKVLRMTFFQQGVAMRGLAILTTGTALFVSAAALPEAPGEIRLAQFSQNPPPARPARPPAAPQAPAQAPAPQPPAATPAPAAPPAEAGPQNTPPPPIPTRTEILNLDNWVVTCNEFAEGPRKRVCSALLHIVQQNTNQVVFSWTVAVENNKQMVTVMQTPTGVAIQPGVELRVGKLPPHKVPFATCDTGRCVATMPMDSTLLHEMTVVPTAEAIIQGMQGNSVQFNIQLKGFDKAYAVLSRS